MKHLIVFITFLIGCGMPETPLSKSVHRIKEISHQLYSIKNEEVRATLTNDNPDAIARYSYRIDSLIKELQMEKSNFDKIKNQ